MAKKQTKNEEPIEKVLWATANKLRKNIDAAEYKHVVLGLIFLRYISDAFEDLYQKLKVGEGDFAGADPEDKDEYKAENVFFVPTHARWTYLQDNAKNPEIGKLIDAAMDLIEKENPRLKGVLPKVYAKENLDTTNLGSLVDMIGNIALGDAKQRSADVLGHVFEYFLGEFALAEGRKGGQFYTPRSVVELLVEMLEPYKGRVMDPCCGSGGMFVQSEKFVLQHQGKLTDISIYGQESNQTTWRLCKMNLAIRGLDSTQVKWNNEGSFLKNEHKDVKVDYIIANPPFNDDDWSGQLLRTDARWEHGVPPTGNANYAWIQHFLFHLNQKGSAAFVLADTSLSIASSDEADIRKNLVMNNLVDCIISLPSHLFSNTQIAACIWILSRKRQSKDLKNDILFIDASRKGKLIERKNRILRQLDINLIAETYHKWKIAESNKLIDSPGFCKSVPFEIIEDNNFVLSPNRYIEPLEQEIEINVSNTIESIKDEIVRYGDSITDLTDSVNQLKINSIVELGSIRKLNILSKSLNDYTTDLYKSLIKKYFIDLNFNNKQINGVTNWQKRTFGELFKERKTRVKQLGFCPPIYSLTNNGIQAREEKFTKNLSKSNDNYKVAFEGDMVFGLSREIPNLDVFTAKQGAFSGAYHIYSPYDIRIGLIVGSLMRLKLMEQTDILKGGAREGRGLDKVKLMNKTFIIPKTNELDLIWGG